jgi:hypothetical protein
MAKTVKRDNTGKITHIKLGNKMVIVPMAEKQLRAKHSLDDLLEEWSVLSPGMWDNDAYPALKDWWAVCNDDGIVAYFSQEQDAFRFRLAEINRILNG